MASAQVPMTDVSLFGIAAEFEDAEALLGAAKAARDAGYQKMRAYSPYRVEGLAQILRQDTNYLPWIVFAGFLLGGFLGFTMQYVTDVTVYPINVGGRPFNSWQAFLIITFESAILGAALFNLTALFLRSNLPLPYHPIFNTPNIELASRNRFFLCVTVYDEQFDRAETAAFLQGLEALNVSEVQA